MQMFTSLYMHTYISNVHTRLIFLSSRWWIRDIEDKVEHIWNEGLIWRHLVSLTTPLKVMASLGYRWGWDERETIFRYIYVQVYIWWRKWEKGKRLYQRRENCGVIYSNYMYSAEINLLGDSNCREVSILDDGELLGLLACSHLLRLFVILFAVLFPSHVYT